jgi:hypothetical protein
MAGEQRKFSLICFGIMIRRTRLNRYINDHRMFGKVRAQLTREKYPQKCAY